MAIGNTSHPSFVLNQANPDGWLNMILDLLSYSDFYNDPIYITATPGTIVPGQIYLVGAGSSFATPGTIAIYLTTLSTSIMGIIPNVGVVVGGWTKISGDWVKTQFANGAQNIVTPAVPTTVTLPTTFEGVCFLLNAGTSTIQVNPAAGRTAYGTIIGTAQPAGLYTVMQTPTQASMS